MHCIFPPATLCKVLGWGTQVPGLLASSKWSQVRLHQINNNAIPGPRSAWSQVPGQVHPAASGCAPSSGSATADAWWPGASAGHAARLILEATTNRSLTCNPPHPPTRPQTRPPTRLLLIKCVQIVRDPPHHPPTTLPYKQRKTCFSISAARFWPAAPCTTVREGGSLDLGLGMHIIMYGFRLLPVGVSLKITRITPPPRPLHTVVLSRQSEGNHRGYLLRPIHAPDLLALCNPLPKVVQPPPKQRFSP
jgi:hypothetical protein